MSDEIDRYIEILNDTLSEEKVLELLSNAEYNKGATLDNIQDHIITTTKMLSDSIAQLNEGSGLHAEQLQKAVAGTSQSVENSCTVFDIALNTCRENVSMSLQGLDRLELAAKGVDNQDCGDNASQNQRRIDSGVGVIKTVALGAPTLKINLEKIWGSQTLIESAATTFEDFCGVLIEVESELLQILGKVHSLKGSDEMKYNAQLDNIYFALVRSLQTISDMRNVAKPIEKHENILSIATDPFADAYKVIVKTLNSTHNYIQESRAAIDFVESKAKFIYPVLEQINQKFNAQQKSMGLQIVRDTAANLPLIRSNLKEVAKLQSHIHTAVQVFTKGCVSLLDIHSNLLQIKDCG